MDYQAWHDYFSVNSISYEEAGLMLQSLWQEAAAETSEVNVFCMFKVFDYKKAVAFLDVPELAQQREKAGVIEREHYFINELPNIVRH
ncbi:hypothetical protein [Vibrio aphrogenes]|uniref:hypothetical protein n=1 Tax=Vibrio aphrogenes TaxID=1891186 RepID=UPI0013E06EF4|nr:hypothetical protein [Vibrio aphrogenes]